MDWARKLDSFNLKLLQESVSSSTPEVVIKTVEVPVKYVLVDYSVNLYLLLLLISTFVLFIFSLELRAKTEVQVEPTEDKEHSVSYLDNGWLEYSYSVNSLPRLQNFLYGKRTEDNEMNRARSGLKSRKRSRSSEHTRLVSFESFPATFSYQFVGPVDYVPTRDLEVDPPRVPFTVLMSLELDFDNITREKLQLFQFLLEHNLPNPSPEIFAFIERVRGAINPFVSIYKIENDDLEYRSDLIAFLRTIITYASENQVLVSNIVDIFMHSRKYLGQKYIQNNLIVIASNIREDQLALVINQFVKDGAYKDIILKCLIHYLTFNTCQQYASFIHFLEALIPGGVPENNYCHQLYDILCVRTSRDPSLYLSYCLLQNKGPGVRAPLSYPGADSL